MSHEDKNLWQVAKHKSVLLYLEVKMGTWSAVMSPVVPDVAIPCYMLYMCICHMLYKQLYASRPGEKWLVTAQTSETIKARLHKQENTKISFTFIFVPLLNSAKVCCPRHKKYKMRFVRLGLRNTNDLLPQLNNIWKPAIK